MVVVPLVIPPTTPVAEPTVPTPGLLLLQEPVPPNAAASLNVIVDPLHTELAPLMVPAPGATSTLIFTVVTAVPQNALVSV